MKWLRFLVFLAVLSLLIVGMHAHVWLRLLNDTGLATGRLHWLTTLWFTMALLCPMSIVVGRRLPRLAGKILTRSAYSWFGVLSLLFCFFLLSEPLRFALLSFGSDPVPLAQRFAIASGVSVVLLLVHGTYRALSIPRVKHVKVALEDFPAALNGLRIVQLTDCHIGATLGRAWLEQVVERVNDTKPDLVVLTGDLVDGSVSRLRHEVRPLSKLKATHGSYFVTGNHEYYSGADAWIEALQSFDLKPLRNELVLIGDDEASFELLGVDDYNAFGPGHGADLDAALRTSTGERATILLAHQPKQIHEAAERGISLQLSGHTHGGQIFPFHFLVRLQQPFVAGLQRVANTQLYISRGTGFWGPPLRIAAPPEITLLELTAATP